MTNRGREKKNDSKRLGGDRKGGCSHKYLTGNRQMIEMVLGIRTVSDEIMSQILFSTLDLVVHLASN